MESDRLYRRAKRRANMKIGFVIHVAVYLAVMVFLLFINAVTWSGYPWFLWPLGGWGFGLVIHGLVTFLAASGGVAQLRDRLIEEDMKRTRVS